MGGGVQGLCLLRDLVRRRWRALLLERGELGGEQTSHSHVYIHSGHVYGGGRRSNEEQLIVRLAEAAQHWRRNLLGPQLQAVGDRSWFGFASPASAAMRTALWEALGLPYRPLREHPSVLAGGAVRALFETDDVSLDGTVLVTALSGDPEIAPFIVPIAGVRAITLRDGLEGAPSSLETRATGSDGQMLVFRTRALVLAAGRGNQELLDLVMTEHRRRSPVEDGRSAQQIRRAHMLVIRGPKECLPWITGVFPDLRGLFIVCRELQDSRERVWLVSDYRSPHVDDEQARSRYVARWWVPDVLEQIERLAPAVFSNRELFQWGVYPAEKAEGRAGGGEDSSGLPCEWVIRRLELENVWAVWPTKLTLAPLVSEDLVAQLEAAGVRPRPGAATADPLRNPAIRVRAAPERWKQTALLTWPEFWKSL